MTNRKGLLASTAGNVLFAALVAYLLLDRQPQPVPEGAAQARASTPTSAPLATASVEDEKVLALARLEAAFPAVEESPFWRADADQGHQRQMQALESHRDRIRSELIARYGADAVDDPAFTRLFKPLKARFPYLSSKSQLAMLKLQQTRPAPTAGNNVMLRGSGQGIPDAVWQRQLDYEARVRAILTPAEWQEYQLRESRAAKQLRASGVAADEREFRAIFAVIAQVEQDATAASLVAAQERLSSMLGARRYASFSAVRDPAYGALAEAASRHDLTPQQLNDVYIALLDAHNKLTRLNLNPTQDLSSPDGKSQQIIEQQFKDVARVVGDAKASDLIDAYMNQTMNIAPRQISKL